MRKYLIGAAAIALAASGALAEPGGKGGGGGKGHDKAQAAQAHGHHGGSQAKQQAKPSQREAKADKRPTGAGEPRRLVNDERGKGAKVEGRTERKAERHAERRVVERAEVRDDRVNRRDVGDVRVIREVAFRDDRPSIIEGCPPGLAKNNGCLPPGLAKKRHASFGGAYYQPSWWGYDRLEDGRYVYGDGYLYRLGSDDSVLGYLPLLGGALSVGNPWPSYYDPAPVPEYYQDYYNLGPADGYRYADDVLYRVDPQSGVIDSIAALLTGDTFAVGQPMPAGYDVYNVPYGYQERYYDNDAAQYRYADGYIYEVDPQTQLIQAVIELLV